MDYLKHFSQFDDILKDNVVINVEKNTTEISDSSDTDTNDCDDCGTKNSIVYDCVNANIICNECGIIKDGIVNNVQEWSVFDGGENGAVNPTRCGKPINPLLPKSSLGTTVGCYTGATYGKYKNLFRLHKWNQMPPCERSLNDVFIKIDEMLKETCLTRKVKDESKKYYKMLSEKDDNLKGSLTRGDIRKSLIAACIFVSCKNNNKPLRPNEIAKICGINKSDVTRGMKKFSELEKNKNLQINQSNSNIHDYINKYAHKINMDDRLIKLSHLIYIRAKKINILKSSNNTSACSGLLYFISKTYGLSTKKIDITRIVEVSEVTLNKVYKELLKYQEVLMIGLQDY